MIHAAMLSFFLLLAGALYKVGKERNPTIQTIHRDMISSIAKKTLN
jgi:uncharacterized membrane protein